MSTFDPDQFKKDVAFSDVDLTSAMMAQASLYAHYAVISSQCQFAADKAKQREDLLKAVIDKEIRDRVAADGTKITEAAIDKEIDRDSRMVKTRLTTIEARAIAELSKQALFAFSQRRDMLIQLGAAAREEMKGELRTLAREEAASDARSQSVSLRANALKHL